MTSVIQVRLIEPHEYDTWDSFVGKSPQGSLFHTSHWKRMLDESAGGPTQQLWGAFGWQSILGGCVVLERQKFGQRTAVTPLLTPYNGFLLSPQLSEKFSSQVSQDRDVLNALMEALKKRYPYQSLINTPALDDVRPLLNAGYRVTPRYTYEINLRLHEDELWKRLDGSVRQQIKKGLEAKLEVSGNLDSDAAWRLFEDNFFRRGERCPVPKGLFLGIAEGSHLKDFRSNYCVLQNGTLISFVTVLRFQDVVYYSLAATAGNKMDLGVSPFLIWEVIRVNGADHASVLDFVGANIGSIARFKEGFNPRLRVHFQAEYFGGVYIKIGHRLRKAFRL